MYHIRKQITILDQNGFSYLNRLIYDRVSFIPGV